jgi:hypothetical protein
MSKLGAALAETTRLVTKNWTAAKRQADRQGRVNRHDLERLRLRKAPKQTIKDACYLVMTEAYLEASGNGRYPANARQVMYSARRRVLHMTGGRWVKNSSTFTQHYLPDYIDEHPSRTAGWDVVFDARGHISEPHTGRELGLGGVAVRAYVENWTKAEVSNTPAIDFEQLARVPTRGPVHRFGAVLFVEKEGFDALLRQARLANRFDLAIMSTKGMSVTAARQLVDSLSQAGLPIFILHDFDKSGLSILHTLRTDSRRYTFWSRPNMIDLGLRLTDVRDMNLESEPVEYDSKADPRIGLRKAGATEAECTFLVRDNTHPGHLVWRGERVELNAMTSEQFIAFVERKLAEHGVEKVVPDHDTLANAYRRAVRLAMAKRVLDKALDADTSAAIDVPPDIDDAVADAINGTSVSWDEALWRIANQRGATNGGAQ